MNNPSVGTASTLDELLSCLPSDPNLRGKAFEKVAKWFLQTDPAYTSELSEVWLWDEWPDRFGADIGIDLVAKTLEGDLWAVQVKGYDPENQVPTREIDSFISADYFLGNQGGYRQPVVSQTGRRVPLGRSIAAPPRSSRR